MARQETDMPKLQRLVAWLGVALLLATLANGAVTYLERVGVLERPAYDWVRAFACAVPGERDNLSARCLCIHEQSDAMRRHVLETGARSPAEGVNTYDVRGPALALKLAKDVLFASFVLLSLWLLMGRKASLVAPRAAMPVLLLVANVGLGVMLALLSQGPLFAAMGLRSFGFLAVALLGAWAAGTMPTLARWVAWILAAQVILVAVELLYGFPLSRCPSPFRAAGSLVMPNTLGCFVVVAFAFLQSFLPGRAAYWWALLASVLLLLASGSGTGLVALAAVLAFSALQRFPGRRGWLALVALITLGVALLAALPLLTSRPQLYESIVAEGGRMHTFMAMVEGATPLELALGRGIGSGSNTAASLAAGPVAGDGPQSGQKPFHADSTVTMMIAQLGVLGLFLFYGMVCWAFCRDVRARPAYLAIAISSITINITEVFPVNFLLGLLLAHTIACAMRFPEGAGRGR